MFKNLINNPHHKKLNKLFNDAGYELRFVGGCVRDSILGVKCTDVDFCTNATPEQMLDLPCKKIETGLQHGTLTFVINNENYEVTTLRVDNNCDGRHALTSYTVNWKLDANRRDFTINAMSVDFEGNLYDYFNGVEDLSNNIVRFVGDTNQRINEDYLRILRYYRFILKTSATKSLSDITVSEIIKQNLTNMVSIISKERIWDEMSKILSHYDTCFLDRVLKKMDDDGVLSALGFKHLRNVYRLNNIEEYVSQMFFDEDEVQSFMKSYKCANSSIAYATLLNTFCNKIHNSNNLEDLVDFFVYWIIFNKGNMNDFSKVCEMTDNLKLYYLVKYKMTKLTIMPIPVNGQDLFNLGFRNATIGENLLSIRYKWIASFGEMTKEQLLEGLNP